MSSIRVIDSSMLPPDNMPYLLSMQQVEFVALKGPEKQNQKQIQKPFFPAARYCLPAEIRSDPTSPDLDPSPLSE